MDRIPQPHPGEYHVQGDHQDNSREHVDKQDARGHESLTPKTESSHGVPAHRGQDHGVAVTNHYRSGGLFGHFTGFN